MIKFILPLGFNNIILNQQIIEENNYNNLFWGIQTDLPFSIFTGRVNNNLISSFIDYSTLKDCVNQYNEISNNLMIFDFSNLCLDSKDYYNCFGKIVFEEYADKNNCYFEVADEHFIEYLIKTYPQIQIILHENYTIFHTEKEIQKLISKYSNNIKVINITILNLCENINIPKIGILNLDSCYYCPQYPLCLKQEHNNILDFKIASTFNECKKKKLIEEKSLIENLKILLTITDTILFGNISFTQINDYIQLINKILEKEKDITEGEI